MPVSHFGSGSEIGSGTTITWTLPAGVIQGDVITAFVQTDAASGVTLTTPASGTLLSGSGRVPGAGALPFYSWNIRANGGETLLTSTASSSTPWFSGFVIVRGRNLFLVDSAGNNSTADIISSPALNGLVDSMLVGVDGCEHNASITCSLGTATPTLTVTEQFDAGSTTPDCWVAGYTAPITAQTSTLTITNTRSATPSGGTHTVLWYIWGEGPEVKAQYGNKQARMRASYT